MKLAQMFAGATIVEGKLNAGTNLAAYAAKSSKGTVVALINKDQVPADIAVSGFTKGTPSELWKLSAPAIDSETDVTFAKSAAPSGGLFHLAPYTATVARYS
jgi:hypothetical protein